MEVILKETVPALGHAGDIVKVKPGYARNYLLPRKLAVTADPKNVREWEHFKRMAQAKRAKEKSKWEAAAKKVEGLTLTIARPAGEEQKLFGSVTRADVAQALRGHDIEVDKRQILLEKPVKTLGTFEINVRLHPDVQAALKVEVVKEAAKE